MPDLGYFKAEDSCQFVCGVYLVLVPKKDWNRDYFCHIMVIVLSIELGWHLSGKDGNMDLNKKMWREREQQENLSVVFLLMSGKVGEICRYFVLVMLKPEFLHNRPPFVITTTTIINLAQLEVW